MKLDMAKVKNSILSSEPSIDRLNSIPSTTRFRPVISQERSLRTKNPAVQRMIHE